MDIAIAGISGLYPDAADLDRLYANLCGGVDSVRPLAAQRAAQLTVPPSGRFAAVGALERIDAFDHAYFNISRTEAEYMDPQQRILLQLACAAVEDAGLSCGELRGSRTGVFVGASNSDYYRALAVPDPTAVSGNLPSALAGRIAYQLGLRGPALVIDTACSSSLVAIVQACDQLALGRIEMALAGGINLFFAEDPMAQESGIVAPDGRCKTFDAAADGAGWGEGGGMALLLPLSRAQALGLPVHAVIKGGAVNQDADRSNGITAPSPAAQAEVIAEALERAGVDADTIGYVEAHGTGTALGDPIEIQGLTQAFARTTARKGFCAIGSVKTNFGHLMGAAGIAGVTKAVLGLRHRRLFPSLHYSRPNPFIDFDDSPVFVNAELRDWPAQDAHPRRVGVSSFGLSGTNAHLILEEAPAVSRPAVDASVPVVATVSARSAEALVRSLERLADRLADPAFAAETPLADIACTLNCGRDHHAFRFAAAVDSPTALREALAQAVARAEALRAQERGLVLLFGDEPPFADDAAADTSTLDRVRAQARQAAAHYAGIDRIETFLRQWARYLELEEAGLRPVRLIGTGTGAAVVDLIQKRLDLDAALAKAAGFEIQAPQTDLAKLGQLVDRWMQEPAPPVFVEIGDSGALGAELARLREQRHPQMRLHRATAGGRMASSRLLAELYRDGVDIDWTRHHAHTAGRRVSLPTYPFQPVACWNPSILRMPEEAMRDTPAEAPALAVDLLRDPDATDPQRMLAALWVEVLKLDEIALDTDYFDVGGHSLNGLLLLKRIQAVFGVELQFDAFYDHPTLRALAAHIDSLAPAETAQTLVADNAAERGGEALDEPLSFMEQRLWFLDQLEPNSPLYNLPMALRIRGALEVEHLRRALDAIIQRHDTLRTAYPNLDGRPGRKLFDAIEMPFEFVDLGDRAAAEIEDAAQGLVAAHAADGFDLSRPPLVRALLIRLGADDHLLSITMHHIVSDLWSMGLLVRELTLHYRARLEGIPAPLPALSLSYARFAREQRERLGGEALDRLFDYWREHLRDAPELLTIPGDRPRPPVQTYRGRNALFAFPPELSSALRDVARREDATLFMVLLAGLQILLHRYTGERVIPIGTPVAGRGRGDTEHLIGFFANTLVIAADAGGDPSVREFLARVRRAALGAYAHQEIAFEKLVDHLQPARSLDRTPLFQVMLALQNVSIDVPALPGLSIEASEPESGTAQFDVTLSLREEAGALVGRIQYNTDLYDESTVQRVVAHLHGVYEAMVGSPELPLSALPVWRRDDGLDRLREWNATERAYADADRPLHALIVDQARRTPSHPAVVAEDGTLSYAELDAQTDRLAARLRALGVGDDQVVGVCAERSREMVVALVAILKAGAAYLPLDPTLPQARLAYMAENSRAPLILAQSRFADLFAGSDVAVEPLLAQWPEVETSSLPAVSPLQAAYVIYTSGTTGLPKGVAVPHRGIVNRLLWMQEAYAIGPEDRVLQKTPYTFDVSVWEFFWPLLTGATLVMARPEGHRDPQYLAELIARERITTLHFVPSMLSAFLQANPEQVDEARPEAAMRSLRQVICSGEALGTEQVSRFHAGYTAALHNLYGPTEASVDVSYWACEPGHGRPSVPIGYPIANTQLYVLDAGMGPVPVGVPGELYIGGTGLARGYLGRPALTAERFVPDPYATVPGERLYRTGDLARFAADGSIEFLGRLDHQVKLRGFRIELGEIEHALSAHPQVAQALVLLHEREGHAQLVAYVAHGESPPPEPASLRAALAERLPEYMIPAQYVLLPSFPVTPNGKLDRKALPDPAAGIGVAAVQGEYVAPRTETEEALSAIWSRLLGRERVGVRENFFALGGDSILSVQMVARAREAGIHLTPRQTFQHQTIEELARVAGQERRVMAEQGPVTGPAELGPIQRWLLALDAAHIGRWNQAVWVRGEGEWSAQRMQAVLDALRAQHDALRHRFATAPDRQWGLAVEDDTGLQLEVRDLGELSAAEREAALEALAETAQAGVDPWRGPVARAVAAVWPGEWRLLLAIHHLVVDGVSWRILLEDLARGYRQLSHGEPLSLGPKTTAYAAWTQRLRAHAQAGGFDEESAYWERAVGDAPVRLPAGRGGTNRESEARVASETLDATWTARLLHESGSAYNTQAQDLLVSALADALLWWSGRAEGRVLIDLEGHGREALFEDVDLTRTVGWFTALYPVGVWRSRRDGEGEGVVRVKETLRQVPHRGVGYGALRHLRDPERLSALPAAEVSFNYLGNLDHGAESDGGLSVLSAPVGRVRDGRCRRPHRLEVSADVTAGRLSVRCAYDGSDYDEAQIAALLSTMRERLLALVAHCAEAAGHYTPSDFTDEALSEQDLEAVFEQIGRE